MEVAVQEEISEELSQETWLSEVKIEEAIEETVEESNGILETLQKAVEEHRADVKDAIKEANVPLPSCSRGEASALADVTDARLVDLMADDEAVTAGGAQSSAALAAPVSGGFGLEATTEADPEWLTAFYCKLHEDGRERQTPALPTSPTPESLGHGQGQGSMTPEQQALHVARQCMQVPHTAAEMEQFVRTLAIALGASRTEAGTIKALLAVLVSLERLEMSEEEAYTSTGASMSNFKKWQKRVQRAQLGASLP